MTNHVPHSQVDIAIVGGGLVGMALALALAKSPLSIKIAIFERQPWQPPKQAGKALALNIATETILQQLGVWSSIHDCHPLKQVCVSEQGRWGQLNLPADYLQMSALGYLVPESELKQVLWYATQDCDQVEWWRPAQIERLHREEDDWWIHLNDSSHSLIKAQGVVAADGQNSWVRSHLGYTCQAHQLDEWAVVGELKVDHEHQAMAHERVTPQGTLALLPARHYGYDWVLTGTSNQTQQWQDSDDNAAKQVALSQMMNGRVGDILQVRQRGCYPLKWLTMPEQYGPGVVFLGNSAHSIHPIAGQGFNLSMRDMVALVNRMIASDRQGLSIFDQDVLQAYQRQRQSHQNLILNFTHFLKSWVGASHDWRACLRSYGLGALDMLPYAKRRIMRQLAGLEDQYWLLK